MQDTKNPIYMDSNYSFRGTATDKLPVFTDIVLRNVRIAGEGTITLEGFDAQHRLGMSFDNVHLDTPSAVRIAARFADLLLGPGPVNFLPAGEDVKVASGAGKGSANSCAGKFVPMPAR
jgi:polygalacturonase